MIGPGGSFIKAIVAETGAQITMPDKEDTETEVKLFGDRGAVHAAKICIRALMKDGFCAITHPGWDKDEVDFPTHKLGRLIGKKAKTIKFIQDSTGCKINTPDKDTPADMDGNVIVTIAGPEEGRIRARLLILQAQEDDPDDIIIDEVDPDWATLPDPSFYEW